MTQADSRGGGEESPTEMCSVARAISHIGTEWRLIVLYELADGEQRFNELKRATGANGRTLSRVLDDLQDAGLVSRRLEDGAPVATYYRLTEKGVALAPVFEALEQWGSAWLDSQ